MPARWTATRLFTFPLLVLAALAGCSLPPPVDATQAAAPVRPLIIVPGMQGTRLVSTESGKVVWGIRLDLLLGAPTLSELALPVSSLEFAENRDDLVPAGIIEDAVVQDFYGEMIAALEASAGYTCVTPEEIEPSTTCVLFAWDWRRDLVEAAARLEQTVEALRDARSDPDLQVDIIAHSAGALVTRYFVRYGGTDVLDANLPTAPPLIGASSVHTALLIAPPNHGSIYGLQRAMRGVSVGLSRIGPELTATMPSVYQLLPHPDRQWMIDLAGDPVWIDLYDAETWRTFGEGIFRLGAGGRSAPPDPALERFFAHALERGARFQRSLTTPVTSLPTRYVLFGASCKATPAVCLLGHDDGRPAIRLTFREAENLRSGVDYRALMLAPGDGRVTVDSLTGRLNGDGVASFPFEQVYFACKNHGTLPSHSGLISAVLSTLDSRAGVDTAAAP